MATPALGNVTIEGVEKGQVVTGELYLSAVSSATRTQELSLHVIGPDGTEVIQRTNKKQIALLTGEDGEPAAWDSSLYPEGDYVVAAYATTRGRSGRQIFASSVNFVVEREAVVGQSAVAEAVVETVATVTAEDTDIATPDTPEDSPELATVTTESVQQASVQVAAASVADTSGLSVSFAAGTLSERQIGDSQSVQIQAQTSDDQANADVLVIVWNDDESELVSGYKREFSAEGTQTLTAADLDQLPAGNLELQAHYRVDGRIRQTAKHKFVNNPGATELPAVSFAAGVADAITIGNAQSMLFEVDGALPSTGDVLILAWSIDDKQLVPGFAHVITEAPFEITDDKLNGLPAGLVELQLRPRLDGSIKDKIVNTVTVSALVSADLPAGEEEAEGEVVVTDDGETATADGSTDDSSSEAPADGGEVTSGSGEVATDDGEVEVVATEVEINLTSSGVPSEYTLGSGATVSVDVTGDLPDGADILMLMWHNDYVELVSGFAHELTSAPFEVSNAMLDAVPAGNAELQALLRVPGEGLVIKKRSIRIIDPNAAEEEEAEETTADTGSGSVDYSDLNLSSTGFTVFTKSSDTQVIYVAADGNDNNDGLSASSPMKTPSVAYQKLRSGYPDWLLFKAGDTFYGNLGGLYKSGRSSSEPMLIGAYGDGARPIFHSPDSSWARKEFKGNADHVAFVGLHLIAINRKEAAERGDASGMDSSQWKQSGISLLGDAEDILIEDCILEYFKFALVFQSGEDWGYMKDIKVRRSSMINSYGHWDKNIGGHSSGAYIEHVDGLLLEENVWSHNGYNDNVSGAIATKFNHNIYVQSDSLNCVVNGNIIANGSAHGLQLRPGGTVDDNLFVSNPMAMYVARHESYIRRNVVLQSDDMGTDAGENRGFGMQTLPCVHAHFENNIISQKLGTAEWGGAIGMVWSSGATEWLDGQTFKVTLKDNHIYNWPRYDGRESAINHETPDAQIVENTRNYLDTASGGDSDPPWIDPTRDVESYMESIGETPTLDAFIDGAVYRPRGQWVTEFTADAVNQYVRRGFDFEIGD